MEEDLKGYSASRNEHYKKIVKAMGDPTKVYDIRGWLGDCRHFIEKIYELSIKSLNNGKKVFRESPDGTREYLDQSDVANDYGFWMEWIDRAERQNEEVARKHGY